MKSILGTTLCLPLCLLPSSVNALPGPVDSRERHGHKGTSSPGPGVESYEIGGGNGTTYWPYVVSMGEALDETFTNRLPHCSRYYIYKSAPFNPPVWEINVTGETLAPGLIFTTPSDFSTVSTTKQPAPQIFTTEGQLVWSGPTVTATNLKWQNLNGEPTLTFWAGDSTAGGNIGHGYGNVTFLDTSYQIKHVICPNFNLTIPGDSNVTCHADLHELYITDRNTILTSAYNATPADLTAVNGSANGWVFDSLFFEIEPTTGEVLFKWSALDHVPVSETHEPLAATGNASRPFDYFHINSVVNIGDYYLANARHTWTVYLLDKQGNIVWRFAGDTGGDFGSLPDGGTFRWQHHPRAHNVSNTTLEISIFNNNNQALDNSSSHPTNTLLYRLPFQPNNNTPPVLLRDLRNTPPLFADSQGSYEPYLTNGNQLANFGQLPLVKEYGPAGGVRWSGRAGPDNLVQLYRSYKQVWHATPSTTPSLVVLSNGNGTTEVLSGYVSWNGATDLTGWNVYEGTSEGGLHYVGQVWHRGFETKFDVAVWAEYVQVGAVVNGTEVRRSETVRTSDS